MFYNLDDLRFDNVANTHTEADVLLNSTTEESDSSDDGEQKYTKKERRRKQKKEQTLYDWLSKSPVSGSAVQSPMGEERFGTRDNQDQVIDESSAHVSPEPGIEC